MPRRFVPAAALVLALLAGCASAPSSADPSADPSGGATYGPPTSGPAPAPSPATVDLLTHSGTYPATQRTLNTALDRLTHACMAAHGFRYPDSVDAVTDDGDEAAIVDLSGRAAHGYGLTSANTDAGRPAADAYVAALSPARQELFREAMFGSDADVLTVRTADGADFVTHRNGCSATAQRALAGSVDAWARLTYAPEEWGNYIAAMVPGAALYRTALTAWSACMTRAGHPVRTQDDAVAEVKARQAAEGVTAQTRAAEIAVALADGRCALAVHLPAAALAARRALAARLPVQARRELDAVARTRTSALTAGTRVMARS